MWLSVADLPCVYRIAQVDCAGSHNIRAGLLRWLHGRIAHSIRAGKGCAIRFPTQCVFLGLWGGGWLLADGFGVGNNLSNMKVKLFIILVILFGSVIGIVFGSAPLNLIVFAQAVTIFVVPFIAIAILVVANDKRVMGELKNKWLSNTLGIIGLLVLIYLAYNNANNIFFS